MLALAHEHRPKLILCGGSAYPRTVDTSMFRRIADEVGALLWCDMAHFAGLVAAGLHPNPVEDCDVVTSTTHKTLAGPRAGLHPLPRGARAGDRPRDLPGPPGRAARARDRGEGDVLPDRGHRGVPRATSSRCARTPTCSRETLIAGGLDLAHGRHRHAPAPARPPRDRVDGQGRRGAAPRGRRHDEPQHRPVRRAAADDRVGRADRHAGGDDARLRRGRLPRGRRASSSTRSRRTPTSTALARAQRGALRARDRCTRASAATRPTSRRAEMSQAEADGRLRGPRDRGHAPARAAQARAAARRHDDDADVPAARQRADAAPHVRGDEGPRRRGGRDRDAARADERAADLRQEGRRLPDPARRGRDARRRALARSRARASASSASTATRRRSSRSSTT